MDGRNRSRVAAIAAALAGAVALLAGGALAPLNSAHAQTPPEDFVPGEILVKFEPGATGQEIAETNRQNDAEVDEVIPGIGVRVVDVPVGRERSAVAAYERNPNVSYAELNGVVRPADHGDPHDALIDQQWQYHHTKVDSTEQLVVAPDIDAFEAWRVTRGSADVTIAIVDTGIDPDHEDLQGKIIKGRNFSRSGTLDDIYSHGTHVAGSAAAVTDSDAVIGDEIGVAGTCPECRLYNVKVIDDDGYGDVAGLANGIRWSADNGAEVINVSLTSPSGKRTLRKAVNYAWRKGAVLVAAAGNYKTNDPRYPAYYENVIAVAATDRDDAKASFSNYGRGWVDIGAPGVDILSTVSGRHSTAVDRYESWPGTSMATPHVAGVAGLVWSTNLCATGDNICVRKRIEERADRIDSLSDHWPYGRRLNAFNSVSSVSP